MGTCCSIEQYHGEADGTGAYASDIGTGNIPKMTKKERKRQVMEALAAEAKTNELLARIPGRLCRNGATSSVSIFTQQGRKGINQDAMVAWEDYTACKDMVFCGVFDGHGPYGHLVARRVRDSLPSKLASIWKAKMRGDNTLMQVNGSMDSNHIQWAAMQPCLMDGASLPEKESLHNPDLKASVDEDDEDAGEVIGQWRESFVEAFEVMDNDLRRHPSIDCFCSGSTAVTLLKQGEDLVIGNVGDSRAVLATLSDEGDTLLPIQLTVDLKPSLPKEAERILKCKGRVFALEDEPEVPRVWLPYDDAPGLAMARAFGDFCLKDFGLISVPEVTHRKLSPNDQFLVLATDGVWDVLSNQEVVDVVALAPTRATAARALVETAVRAWRLKFPNSKVDDCAVICLFLHPPKGKPGIEVQPNEGMVDNTKEPAQCETAQDQEDTTEDASFGRSNTVRAGNHLMSNTNGQKELAADAKDSGQTGGRTGVDRSHSVRSIADCLSSADEEEWSALEGVVRVNSLLKLPRFLKGDKRASSTNRKSQTTEGSL